MRQDAKQDTVDLLNAFQNVTSSLLLAKREEAVKIAKQLVNTERLKEAAEHDAQEIRQVLEERDAEIIKKNALIERYQALLGVTVRS
jgi:hypothetical protein